MGFHGSHIHIRGTAVVTGKDDPGVCCFSRIIESLENSPDGCIGFHHQISIRTQVAFSLPRIIDCQWCVRCRQGDIQEKGCLMAGCVLQERLAFRRQCGKDWFKLPPFDRRALFAGLVAFQH